MSFETPGPSPGSALARTRLGLVGWRWSSSRTSRLFASANQPRQIDPYRQSQLTPFEGQKQPKEKFIKQVGWTAHLGLSLYPMRSREISRGTEQEEGGGLGDHSGLDELLGGGLALLMPDVGDGAGHCC
jgi:hypothetical protein